jgi:hypothetical protein
LQEIKICARFRESTVISHVSGVLCGTAATGGVFCGTAATGGVFCGTAALGCVRATLEINAYRRKTSALRRNTAERGCAKNQSRFCNLCLMREIRKKVE